MSHRRIADKLGVEFVTLEDINEKLQEKESINELLKQYSHVCSLFAEGINLEAKLGEGKYGSVWLVSFDGVEQKYAMKLERRPYRDLNVGNMKINSVMEMYVVSPDQIKKALPNVDLTQSRFPSGTILTVPPIEMDCFAKEITIEDNLTWKDVTIKNSYTCDATAISEYVIGTFASDIAKRGVCMNFIDVFGFNVCDSGSEVEYVSFMELTHGTAYNIRRMLSFNDHASNSLVVQILFGLYALQSEYKIQHNDLHLSNIFIGHMNEVVKDEEGQVLNDVPWYSYDIGDETYYFQKSLFFARIADFGFAVKYADPLVGNMFSIIDGWGYSYPNMFHPLSDFLYFLIHVYELRRTPFVIDLLMFITKTDNRHKLSAKLDRIIDHKTGRPSLEALKEMSGLSLLDVIQSSAMKSFVNTGTIPPGGSFSLGRMKKVQVRNSG